MRNIKYLVAFILLIVLNVSFGVFIIHPLFGQQSAVISGFIGGMITGPIITLCWLKK